MTPKRHVNRSLLIISARVESKIVFRTYANEHFSKKKYFRFAVYGEFYTRPRSDPVLTHIPSYTNLHRIRIFLAVTRVVDT